LLNFDVATPQTIKLFHTSASFTQNLTRVNQVTKVGSSWEVKIAHLIGHGEDISLVNTVEACLLRRI
jgi:hypothetical protein